MKTCDVCKCTQKGGVTLERGSISSVLIGTDIQVARVGVSHESPVECELCNDCNEKVNKAIDEHLTALFGLRIRA